MKAEGVGRGWVWFVGGAVLLQVLYLLMPFDVIPDLIPFVGWIDDLVVLLGGVGAAAVGGILARSAAEAHLPRAEEPLLDDPEAPGEVSGYEPLSPEEIRAL